MKKGVQTLENIISTSKRHAEHQFETNVNSLCFLIRKFPLTKYVVKPFLEKALALRKPHYQKSHNGANHKKISGQCQKINFELTKSQIIEQMYCLKMHILNSLFPPNKSRLLKAM